MKLGPVCQCLQEKVSFFESQNLTCFKVRVQLLIGWVQLGLNADKYYPFKCWYFRQNHALNLTLFSIACGLAIEIILHVIKL